LAFRHQVPALAVGPLGVLRVDQDENRTAIWMRDAAVGL